MISQLWTFFLELLGVCVLLGVLPVIALLLGGMADTIIGIFPGRHRE